MNKKFFILILLLGFLATTLNAQEKKWFLGGTIGVEFLDSEIDFEDGESNGRVNTYSIIPSIHRMVSKKFAVGLSVGYTHVNYKDYDSKTNLFTFMPSLTYFCHLGSKFYYTPMFGIGAGFGKQTGVYDVDLYSFYAGVEPLSFEFRPTSRIGVNFSAGELSYSRYKMENDTNDFVESACATSDSFKFRLNDSFKFSFRYYF